MQESVGHRRWKFGSPWRWAGWGTAALLLVAPAVAMRFTDEVDWTGGDFVFAAVLLLGVGIPFELAVRSSRGTAYRAAVGAALLGAFLLVWLNGAVGLLGAETNPANALYGGVLLVEILGSLVVLFRPRGMARALWATAFAQALVAAVALAADLGGGSTPLEIVGVNAPFVALFCASAWLFHVAEREAPGARASASPA